MAINLERFVKGKRFTQDHILDDASDQILIKTDAGSSVANAIDAATNVDGTTITGAGTVADPFKVPLATTTVAGITRFATNAETVAGIVTDAAVHPDDMKHALNGQQTYPIDIVGQIRTNGIFWSNVPEGISPQMVLTRGVSATWTVYIPAGAGIGDLRFYNGVDRIIFGQNGEINTGSSVTASSFVTSSDQTLKENVQPIDPAKALQFRNGLSWKKYEMFSEQQVQIMQDVTDSEGNTTQVPTGRYQAIRNSQGIKRGLIAQEVLALAQSIGDFTDVVVEVGEYFTLDAQGYPVKDAQGNNIVNKRLGIDYGSVNVIVMAGEQALTLGA